MYVCMIGSTRKSTNLAKFFPQTTKICSARVYAIKNNYIPLQHKTVFNSITTHYEPPRNHKYSPMFGTRRRKERGRFGHIKCKIGFD